MSPGNWIVPHGWYISWIDPKNGNWHPKGQTVHLSPPGQGPVKTREPTAIKPSAMRTLSGTTSRRSTRIRPK